MLFHADVLMRLRLLVDAPDSESARTTAEEQAAQRVPTCPVTQVVTTQLSVVELLQRENLRYLQESTAVREVCTPNQRERWEAGVLPEPELLALIRDELFAPLEACDLLRRKPMQARELHAWSECTRAVDWSTTDNPELTGEQWRTWRRVQGAVNEIRSHAWLEFSPRPCVNAQILQHKGECTRCQRVRLQQSAIVRIEWAGRNLSREHLL